MHWRFFVSVLLICAVQIADRATSKVISIDVEAGQQDIAVQNERTREPPADFLNGATIPDRIQPEKPDEKLLKPDLSGTGKEPSKVSKFVQKAKDYAKMAYCKLFSSIWGCRNKEAST